MRILATNPDTLGDLVLRQPLYAALQAAGHELMLVIRPLLQPLVSLVAPGAEVVECRENVYDARLRPEDDRLEAMAEAARAFDPDVLLVTPFQWTVLEERLALSLPRARRIAMSGKRFADPHYGPAPESRLEPHVVVQVSEDAPEVRKNELLAGAVLGRAVKLARPRMSPAAEHLRAGEATLSRLGLEVGGYWVACVGHDVNTQVRNWESRRWAEVLQAWSRGHGRRFLMVGTEPERAVAEEIRKAMGDEAGACAVWAGRGDGDLDVLLGLVGHSRGYVGRDTGPMHLSAAMEKPVLAVFGGGTWPRFVPAAARGVSITIGVPCTGCNWLCHLPQSYCIKEVPTEAVLKAVEDLEGDEGEECQVRVLAPSSDLLSRIGREGAGSARERLTQLSVQRREQMEQTESMTEALERTARQAGRADALAEQLERSQEREAELQRQIADLEAGRRVPQALTERLAAAENGRAQAEGQLADARLKLERVLADQQALTTLTRQQEQELRERGGKLAAAQERSRQVHEQFLHSQTELADLRLKLERALGDQQALMSLTRQQEQQLGLMHQRLRDLMNSRWRRYGQRLRLCMTMPWERQYLNGRS